MLTLPNHPPLATFATPTPHSSDLLGCTGGSNISLGKYGTFNTRHLINQPYGHTFEVLPGGELNVVRATIAEVQETAANNQNILSQSKGLEADEVARMKAEGLSGRVSQVGTRCRSGTSGSGREHG